MAAAEVVIRTR